MPSTSTANVVFQQLKGDFPATDAKWVLNKDVNWSPVASIPLNDIDFSNFKNWNAAEHVAKLKKFEKKIKKGDRKPVILGKFDGGKLKVLDGHHRVLAHRHLGMPVPAYVAVVGDESRESALEMHAAQKKGNSGPMKNRVTKFTAETPVASSVHHPFGSPSGPGLWHMKGKQLPAYVQNVAHALLRSGSASDESEAIHKAVGIVQDWAHGKATHGKQVTPTVQAAAQKAMADWYKLRGERASRTASKTFTSDKGAVELAGTTQPKQKRGPNNITALDFHKIPAAMRRVKKYYKTQGLPDDQATAKTIAFFKGMQNSPNPILKEGSAENLKSYKKRKKWASKGIDGRYGRNLVHGKKNDEAGGDTGFSYKQYHFANDHHTAGGKFAGNTKERERILSIFQQQHQLPVTGKLDAETKDLLNTMNKAANE